MASEHGAYLTDDGRMKSIRYLPSRMRSISQVHFASSEKKRQENRAVTDSPSGEQPTKL